jgi:hypothetical protein
MGEREPVAVDETGAFLCGSREEMSTAEKYEFDRLGCETLE